MQDARNDAATVAPRAVRLADYRPPAFLIDTVALAFDLDETATRVTSRLTLRRNPAADFDAPLFLNGEALTPIRVVLDGAPAQYRVVAGGLMFDTLPNACTLEIETRIAPKDNTELSGL